jgi:multicomponent Na+:H+ antiporter subunit C
VSGFVEVWPVLVAVWLLLAGLYGMATTRDLVHLVLSVSVFHAGAWVLLLGVGFSSGVTAPIVDEDVTEGQPLADPVVQAITVTDVVVGAAVTALLLTLAVRVKRRFGTVDPRDVQVLRG